MTGSVGPVPYRRVHGIPPRAHLPMHQHDHVDDADWRRELAGLLDRAYVMLVQNRPAPEQREPLSRRDKRRERRRLRGMRRKLIRTRRLLDARTSSRPPVQGPALKSRVVVARRKSSGSVRLVRPRAARSTVCRSGPARRAAATRAGPSSDPDPPGDAFALRLEQRGLERHEVEVLPSWGWTL
jgi:hypothetical protein